MNDTGVRIDTKYHFSSMSLDDRLHYDMQKKLERHL